MTVIQSLFFLLFGVFCFDILDYDLDSIRNDGPYVVALRNNVFTFNAGRVVPNTSSSGYDDCSVIDLVVNETLVCYGQISNTIFTPLEDGSDGLLISSTVLLEGSTFLKSYIRIECSVDTTINNEDYVQNERFNVTLHSPWGCKGSRFDVSDYDLASLRAAGPFEYSFRHNVFTFNFGIPVPKANFTSQGDCMIVDEIKVGNDTTTYECYGQASRTTYTALPLSKKGDGAHAHAQAQAQAQGILVTSTVVGNNDDDLISIITVNCGETFIINEASYATNLGFNSTIQTPFGCKGSGNKFNLSEYGLGLFQDNGPYTIASKNGMFAYNAGRAVPNAGILTGHEDCSVVQQLKYSNESESYLCYGLASASTYSALEDGSEGVLIKSEGPLSTVSYIRLVCPSPYTTERWTFYSEKNFTAIVPSPYGCRGSNPQPASPDKKKKNYAGVVVAVVLVVLVLGGVGVAAVVCVVKRKKKTAGKQQQQGEAENVPLTRGQRGYGST